MLFGFLARRIERGMVFCFMYMCYSEYVKTCIPGAGYGRLMLLLILGVYRTCSYRHNHTLPQTNQKV